MNFEPTINQKVKLTLEYDGTNYCGWQRQHCATPSIQEKVEGYLHSLFGAQVDAVSAGRTDAGVHALGQVVHFLAPRDVTSYNFVHAGNALLPPDITVKKAEIVPEDFHARYSAVAKTYIYKIWNEPVASATRRRHSLWVRKPLNIERLNDWVSLLVGTHDFNAFRSEGSHVKSTVRTVYSAEFMRKYDYIEFHIRGNGFLKQMVRNIVGTLLDMEIKGLSKDHLVMVLGSQDRKKAGPTAEPQGLVLSTVEYTPELDRRSKSL